MIETWSRHETVESGRLTTASPRRPSWSHLWNWSTSDYSTGPTHPMAKKPWARQQEMNLLYVAITRAIEELIHVS